MKKFKLQEFRLSEVGVTDPYLVNAATKENAYLISISTDRLLAGFRETAGLDMKGVTRYDGWENSLIGSHTMGHYVTACVQAYESANTSAADRKAILEKIYSLATGFKECQDAVGTGYIFGATLLDKNNIELQFDNVEENKGNIFTEAWVPWYTMHKIVAGLVSMACMHSFSEADESCVSEIVNISTSVVSNLADWIYKRTSKWSKEKQDVVLNIEYGGMNDCLYDVFKLTGKEEHLAAAAAFDEVALFRRVQAAKPGDDVLNNIHANTTIPKFLGALNRFTVTGGPEYLDYAEKFWNLVTTQHTYVTGGNSEWEHFGQDGVLAGERTNANNETCNSYNMLKLTKLLYKLSGDAKYADWYERTYMNSILASQNPDTGMTTYFQSMASGYFKVYSEKYTKFWCCTGSGMENFSKLGESFYYYKDDHSTLIVNQYISSKLSSEKFGVTQESTVPYGNKATFTVDKGWDGELWLRVPEWIKGELVVAINGAVPDGETGRFTCGIDSGYLVIRGSFAAGDVIELTLNSKLRAFNLQDDENVYAFTYGPVVLSALLGDKDMEVTTTGVDVTIPKIMLFGKEYLPSESEIITISGNSVKEFMEHIEDHLVRDEGTDSLSFSLKDTDAHLRYVVHYSQHKERYGIYFRFVSGDGSS